MICPECGHSMSVGHSYTAGNSAKTQRLVCGNPRCQHTCVAVTWMLPKEAAFGSGAYALAQSISRGDVTVSDLVDASEE